MLELKNVHKSFGENKILKGVNLRVERGDIIVICTGQQKLDT